MTNKVSEIHHGTSCDQWPSKAGKRSPDSPWSVLMGIKMVQNGTKWWRMASSWGISSSKRLIIKKDCMELILDSLAINASHDYSDWFKTNINISKPWLKTIESIGPYNVIQVIIDNATNCKEVGAIIKDGYPNIFLSKCLVHTLNLLMHDIIKMTNHDYRWIHWLYNKCKYMIIFITNNSNSHGFFHSHSKLEVLKIAKTRFASYHVTFKFLLNVTEALTSMLLSESWKILKHRAT